MPNGNEAPYKLSRAAMRERYGSRAIDASAKPKPERASDLNSNTGNVTADMAAWRAKFPNSQAAASEIQKQASEFTPFVPAARGANSSPGNAPGSIVDSQTDPSPLTGFFNRSVNQQFQQPAAAPRTLAEVSAGGQNSATRWGQAASQFKPTRVGNYGWRDGFQIKSKYGFARKTA